jgi:hypothetical protein
VVLLSCPRRKATDSRAPSDDGRNSRMVPACSLAAITFSCTRFPLLGCMLTMLICVEHRSITLVVVDTTRHQAECQLQGRWRWRL